MERLRAAGSAVLRGRSRPRRGDSDGERERSGGGGALHAERHRPQPGGQPFRLDQAALLPLHRRSHHDRRHGGGKRLRVAPRGVGQRSRVGQPGGAVRGGDVLLRRLRGGGAGREGHDQQLLGGRGRHHRVRLRDLPGSAHRRERDRDRSDPDRPFLDRAGIRRRGGRHGLPHRGLRRRIELERPRRRHRLDRDHLQPHRARGRHHAPLPALGHQLRGHEPERRPRSAPRPTRRGRRSRTRRPASGRPRTDRHGSISPGPRRHPTAGRPSRATASRSPPTDRAGATSPPTPARPRPPTATPGSRPAPRATTGSRPSTPWARA